LNHEIPLGLSLKQFELVINLKTAKQIELDNSTGSAGSADRVIR
jgi:hypothetical protein